MKLREVFERRSLATLFQPIFSFRAGDILGYEALVRGPEGSALETPYELFEAAQREGLVVELNIVCIQETLRAFARRALPGTLFVNISPQMIVQPGFDPARALRFFTRLALDPERVVIELTEDYPTFDFGLVRESLRLYRGMGFRVAIDDLGEGFSSLRLWSELKPEFVKADKHFVTGIAGDAMKAQFLRAIQHLAEASGAHVIAEGIESRDDFRVVRDLGIAFGQGYFIGHPAAEPAALPPEPVAAAQGDARLRLAPRPPLRVGGLRAQDFVRTVEAAGSGAAPGDLKRRFEESPALVAIPVVGPDGLEGLVWRDRAHALDASPIRVEADLDLPGLVALLADARAHLAEAFVVVARGAYLGLGYTQDVLRALLGAHAEASRHVHPLTRLPGAVPIHEHLEKLLGRGVAFCIWIARLEEMAGLNDFCGFGSGDELIHGTARLLEAHADPEIDLVAHDSGARFVVLMQSEDWRERASRALAGFVRLLEAHVTRERFERGYFGDGPRVWPLPRLALGVLPVLPGVFESRLEALAMAKRACAAAAGRGTSACHVDERLANAYPASCLIEPA